VVRMVRYLLCIDLHHEDYVPYHTLTRSGMWHWHGDWWWSYLWWNVVSSSYHLIHLC